MNKIPDLVFQEYAIRCDVCNNFLSVPPILHNDALGSVCGREFCAQKAKSKGTNYRQRAYETLARYLLFPCMYKKDGCTEQLGWDQIGEHEKECRFKNSLCPFSSERFKQLESEVCPWMGDSSALLEHMEEVHHSNKFETYVEFKIAGDTDRNQLVYSSIQSSIVILSVVTDEKFFHIKVWSGLGIWKRIKYNMKLSKPRGQQFLNMQVAELIHPTFFKSEVDDTWLKTDLENVRKEIDSGNSLIIEFHFDGFLIGTPQKVQSNPLALFPTTRKCCRCKKELEYLYFNFKSTRQNICLYCLFKHKFSTDEVEISQNTTFETLNFFIDHSFIKCFLCSETMDSISNHLYSNHNASIIQLDKCYHITITANTRTLSNAFFSFDDHIFFLTLKVGGGNLSFSVQCLESRELKYRYDLKLLDLEISSHIAITYSNFSLPGNMVLSKIPNSEYASSIPLEGLRNFIPFSNKIYFKLNIFKI